MRGSHLAWLSGAALVAGAATSCSVYGTDLLLGGQTATGGRTGGSGGNSGGDVNGDGGAAAGGAGTGSTPGTGGQSFCLPRATYAAPPVSADIITPGGTQEIVAAQWTIDLGDSQVAASERFRTVGFDLDDRCTDENLVLEPRGYTCRLPTWGIGMKDGRGAIDNAMGSIIQGVRNLVGDFSSENYTKQLQAGASNIILRVANYNGEPNDDQVRVEVFVAASYNAFADAALPEGGGNDVWPIASDSVRDDDKSKPLFFDDLGYVSNGTLVGSLIKADLRIDVGLSQLQAKVKLKLQLSGAFVQCDVRSTIMGQWGFTLQNCILAGKWNVNQLLGQLSQFPDPSQLGTGKPLCTNSGAYAGFKNNICEQVDVFDGVDSPSAVCNALSFGAEFDMVPAILGEVYPVNPVLSRCPAGFEPSEDNCETIGAGGRSAAGGGSGAGGRASGGSTGAGGSTDDAGREAGSDAAPADASME